MVLTPNFWLYSVEPGDNDVTKELERNVIQLVQMMISQVLKRLSRTFLIICTPREASERRLQVYTGVNIF